MPPVPNFRDPDPELGELNLSGGGAYPVRYSLRLAAGFGSQISMLLLRWTPVADGRRRNVDELGYDYRVADRAAWEAWLRRTSGYEDPELEVVQHRLRIVDQGPPAGKPLEPAPAPDLAPAEIEPAAIESASVPPPAPVAKEPAAAPRPGAPVAPVPSEPAPVAAPVTEPVEVAPHAPVLATDDVAARVLEVVAEQTGYPTDLLDMDLDLEADLGIDTVKQAEVFAAIREAYGISVDDTLKLRDYPTLNHVVAFVSERSGVAPAASRPWRRPRAERPLPRPSPPPERLPRAEPRPRPPG